MIKITGRGNDEIVAVGLVDPFGQYVGIENDGKQQLVYKHAVSTISPAANITIMQPEKAEKKE